MSIKTGIVGYGIAGAFFHEPLIRNVEGLELRAVSTSSPEKAPRDLAVLSHEALIADPAIDLVVIASPNRFHFPLAQAALLAGKHVVVDKPFTITTAEADELIALARREGRLLTVFQNRRWDGDFLTVQELLQSGRLGQVMLFEAHWDRFRPAIKRGWRETLVDGAGLLFDLGPHLIDQALLLFGRPESVIIDKAIQREGASVDDYFQITLRFGRMRVILSASNLVAKPRPRFALFGTNGAFVKYGLDPQEDMLRAGQRPSDADFGIEAAEMHGTLTPSDGREEKVPTRPGRYLSFYEAVVNAIRNGDPAPVDPADARDALALILAD
jgi:scyllo-inositol 2-dehydrogenase (NADP+)